MSDGRFLCTQFCDDIRQELGNKFSLMGCYGPSMFVRSFPAVLPKLCVQVKAYSPIDRPFTKFIIRVLRDDQQIAEMHGKPDELAAVTKGERPDGVQWQLVTAFVVMTPFAVEGPCVLRVEAETEDCVLNGGRFRIELAPQPPS